MKQARGRQGHQIRLLPRQEYKMIKGLSHERVRELLDYDPETGVFVRKSTGRTTGSFNRAGYVNIVIDKKWIYAHRLAWFYLHGDCPEFVDHINGNKSDNRICNLRPATKSQNGANSVVVRAKSGHRGVFYQSNTKKWRVKIANRNLGYFSSKEEASEAYKTAAIEMYGQYAGHK